MAAKAKPPRLDILDRYRVVSYEVDDGRPYAIFDLQTSDGDWRLHNDEEDRYRTVTLNPDGGGLAESWMPSIRGCLQRLRKVDPTVTAADCRKLEARATMDALGGTLDVGDVGD